MVVGEPAAEQLDRVRIGFSWGQLSSGKLYPLYYESYYSPFTTRGVALGDTDNDTDLDIIFGCLVGHPSTYYPEMPSSLILKGNTGPNSPPQPPVNLQASVIKGEATLTWAPGSDNKTPTGFLTYNLRVGTTPGGNEVFSGVVPTGFGNVGPHLRKLLKLTLGVYYWSVQTVDTGYARSEWAPEQSFVISGPGDANSDGRINALDVTTVERVIGGLDAASAGADANRDGSINALDITKIERMIAGLN